jgi:hypothetical protein
VGLCFARQVKLGQEATLCRIFLQQLLPSQFENVTIPSTLWEKLSNSIALGPAWQKAGVWSGYFAWRRREYQNSSRESKDSTVQTAKLRWHQKKIVELRSGRLYLPEGVTHQRNQKVRSQGQARTSIHRTVQDLGKTWRSGIPTQPTRKFVSRAWCVLCVSAEEVFASTRRAISNRGPLKFKKT